MTAPVATTATALVALLGLATALSTALSACTSDTPDPDDAATTPSATPTPAPEPPPRPEVGTCHRLTYDEALAPADEERVVDCAKAHTSQTYAVGQLDTAVDGHELAVDAAAVRAQVAERCPGKLARFVGATEEQLRLSMLRPVWFTPTFEQSDLGASWFRCDVIAVAGEDRLAKVRGTLKAALASAEGRTTYGMCGTAEPGTDGFERVLCSEDHTWRAIDSVTLEGKAPEGKYPGADAVREAGQEPCAEAGRTVAADALDYEWGYEWPTPEQWRAGQHFGRCWAPDDGNLEAG